jgi:hypothetical protein
VQDSAVELPGGLRFDSGWRRDARLRPLSGHDELFLLEEGRTQSMAARTTALLARCVTRLGDVGPVRMEDVRRLRIGDREALLLHLRRLTLGERVSCVLSCPSPQCGKPMELELSTQELLVPTYPHTNEIQETEVETVDGRYRLRFRLPNGGDQEAIADTAAIQPEAAATVLLQRCVQELARGDSEMPVSAIPPTVAEALSAKMAELDPQAEILLELRCPDCGVAFFASLDLASFFFQELSGRRQNLYREIHLMAISYRWSEDAILGLTRARRQLYLDLLCGTAKESASRE